MSPLKSLLDNFDPSNAADVEADVDVVLLSHEVKTARTGREYHVLILGDGKTQIDVKDFRGLAAKADFPQFGRAHLRIEAYNGGPSAMLDGFDALDESEVDVKRFVGLDPDRDAANRAELPEILGQLSGPYAKLAEVMFDEQTREDFLFWPAAKRFHHAYPGGLAEHSLEVVRLALALAEADPSPYDRDLLVLGCLIHDLGKLDEYQAPPGLGWSGSGQLASHLAYAHLRLGRAQAQLAAQGVIISDLVVQKLMHLVEQSHGSERPDSMRHPIGKEARCLAAADNHSAQLRPREREQQIIEQIEDDNALF